MTMSPPATAPQRGNVRSLAARRADRVVPESVLRTLTTLTTRYAEPLTLDVLAAEVNVSPFHLSRVFAIATGTTPGRYLTAVRMFEAKRLLLTTSATVSDVVCAVGYSSVGTFTSRFTRVVGMPPSQYRDPTVGDLLLAVAPHFRHLPAAAAVQEAGARCARDRSSGTATVAARIVVDPDARPADLIVGVFADPIPQCGPVAFAAVAQTGTTTVTLPGVPAGRWSLLAAAEHRAPDGSVVALFGSMRAAFTVGPREELSMRLRMRPLRPADPPIAVTLADRVDHPVAPLTALRAAA